jgi:hypothetical protein
MAVFYRGVLSLVGEAEADSLFYYVRIGIRVDFLTPAPDLLPFSSLTISFVILTLTPVALGVLNLEFSIFALAYFLWKAGSLIR